MRKLFIFALTGFLAQLIDGPLGMGFGASSSPVLLTYGVAPAVVSATVYFSEIVATAAFGTSHWKLGNVHKPITLKLAVSESISGFIGAALLTQVHSGYIEPYIVLFLLSMGFYILYQFLFKCHKDFYTHAGTLSSVKLVPQGAVASFLDATGGGGWGPANTPLLLASHRIQPRYVIGTVSASGFFVILSASLGFTIFLGFIQINWWLVTALSIDGMIAASISAYLTKILPINILVACVGGLIILASSNALMTYLIEDVIMMNVIRFAIICAIIVLVIIIITYNKRLSFSYK